ncbi:UNVERIFIED_CONTAM: FAD-dependent oxidoreductase, partial [Salmonella enterica subsp. enterica serovar Weltevreden]
GGVVLKDKIEELGVSVHLNKNTSFFGGDKEVKSMNFADGSVLDVDMVVISAGIKPRDELAVKYGLVTGPRGGIEVNDKLQTSDKDIYAIGE